MGNFDLIGMLGSGWSFILNLALVIVGLGLIVFLHELGHFMMAKKNGVRVEIFSLGFGKAIWKRRRGDTEYRIAWLPLGGYVKMAGEAIGDDRKGEPWELSSKTPWQRFQIYVAGAVMNFIIAFPIAVLAFVVGKHETPNEVGTAGIAEAQAGLRPGDEILEVDGRSIDSLDKFRIEMIRRPAGAEVPVVVRRDGQTLTLRVTVRKAEQHNTQPTLLAIGKVTEGSPIQAQGLQKGDEIIRIDGKRIVQPRELDGAFRAKLGREVLLGVRRRDPAFKDRDDLEARIRVPEKTWHSIPFDERLAEARIADTVLGHPAHEVLKADDVIVRIDDQVVECWLDLRQAVEPRPNQTVKVTVHRGGQPVTFDLRIGYNAQGLGGLGVVRKVTGVLAKIAADSYFHKAGLRSGDRIRALDGVPGSDYTLSGSKALKIPEFFHVHQTEPRTVTIDVLRGEKSETVKVELKTEPIQEPDWAAMGFETVEGGLLLRDASLKRVRPLGEAVAAGLREPLDIAVMTLEILRKLVTGGESTKNLAGPIGIIHTSYAVANRSFGQFVWLLCVITVNLGIFNLLPIPILDGGHNVLLAIEVVRKWMGKGPPTERFIVAFQYSGLVFILALFVLVTFNDVKRLLPWN